MDVFGVYVCKKENLKKWVQQEVAQSSRSTFPHLPLEI